MSAGATLLKLQQIDLELARNKSELANMPELKELASKRKTYVKLKSEMTKLYAQRKDCLLYTSAQQVGSARRRP